MIKQRGSCVVLACAVMLGGVEAAYAQRTAPAFSTSGDAARQTINFTVGVFTPLKAESRVDDDVLNIDRTFLEFEINDFRNATVGFEWLIPIGNYVEAGAGLSFTRKTVPTIYRDFVDSDDTEIDSDISLRQVPLAFTVRVVPFGQSSPVQPYVGVGLAAIKWRYSEIGEFIGEDDRIFDGEFEADGWGSGPLFLAGIRWGGRSAAIGGEVRYQKAEGDLTDDFFGSKIDLGGWTVQATLGARF